MKNKVLIVDDHFVVREGLKLILETSDQYQVIGEAEDGEVAIRLAQDLLPDVILMDLNMPRMSGLDTMKELKARQCDIPVVILTTYNEDELMISGLALGAKGYLLKDTGREHLFRTIDSAIRGETLLQPEIMARVFAEKASAPVATISSSHKSPLSDKERMVLQAIARGYRSKEIAFDMGISERTVKAHLTNIYNKLTSRRGSRGTRNRASIIARSYRGGHALLYDFLFGVSL